MTRTTKKVPPTPESPSGGGDLETFFSLESVAVAESEDETSPAADISDEEPTIRETVGRIPAFHSLNLPVVEQEVEDGDTSEDSEDMLPSLAPTPQRQAPAADRGTDPITPVDDTWTEFESADDSVMLSSDSLDDHDLDEDLEDSLEWDRSMDDEAPLLTPSTVSTADGLRGAAEQMQDEVQDEDSASVSIAVEDPDEDSEMLDLAGETVRESIVPDKNSHSGADSQPSGEYVSGGAALLQQGIEALQAGDRKDALTCFQGALRSDPDDESAHAYLDLVHDMIIREHLPQASLHSVPRLRVGREMLMTLDIEPNAGGVLAMVDGVATIEDLETMLPYFERDTICRYLAEAYRDGLIEFDS